jgi:hypothetical protein
MLVETDIGSGYTTLYERMRTRRAGAIDEPLPFWKIATPGCV